MITTRQLSGTAKARYLRQLLCDGGAPAAVATRADREIVRVWVRQRADGPAGRRIAPGAPLIATGDRATSDPGPSPPAASPGVAPAPSPPASPAFDPYAFSAMAILLNEGRPVLEALLGRLTERSQILRLAEAQSVVLDPALAGDTAAGIETLRAAFVAAVERRLAHRRAISG